MPDPELGSALELLIRGQVEVVVVGMAAAVLPGAPLLTEDLDVVHRRTPENVARLLRVLSDLDAAYRTDRRRLRPSASHLMGPGHRLLETRLGDLDCLGAIDGDRAYEDLLPYTVEIEIADGMRCRALTLEHLIEVKRRAGRPKDLAVLPALEATLDELRQQK